MKCAPERTGESAVEMLPVHSGYRDEETLRLNLDTDYQFVIEEYLSEDWTPEDFSILHSTFNREAVRVGDMRPLV